MRPMTIVVVREEPAGGSGAGAVAVVAGAAAAVVAGAAEAVVAGGAAAVAGAEVVVAAAAGADGLAVVWAKPADAARRNTARAAESAERRFMAGETIGRAPTRQASRGAE